MKLNYLGLYGLSGNFSLDYFKGHKAFKFIRQYETVIQLPIYYSISWIQIGAQLLFVIICMLRDTLSFFTIVDTPSWIHSVHCYFVGILILFFMMYVYYNSLLYLSLDWCSFVRWLVLQIIYHCAYTPGNHSFVLLLSDAY